MRCWLVPALALSLLVPRPAAARARLRFDPGRFTRNTLAVGGDTIRFRACENLAYAAHPVASDVQRMNVYVPEAYFAGGSVHGYTAASAPIFLPNAIGGYAESEPAGPGRKPDGTPNAVFVALSRGCVVASPGARGRNSRDASGRFIGKAPACIVDLKAAVRYLRHNDAVMPGDAEKIVSNGISAGGAVSALLGAAGNSRDYGADLRALGAADERDDIFAASCYCPITILDHADMAYEWLFNGVDDFTSFALSRSGDSLQVREVKGTLSADEIALSNELKTMFPAYVNALGLKNADGAALTLDSSGAGSFAELVKSFVVASAQKALDGGLPLTQSWIVVENGRVTDIDFASYVRYATRMKTPPAFDRPDLYSPENELFGTATLNARHFTRFGAEHGAAGDSLADSVTVRMMNPMSYLGVAGVTPARHWRIRHGTRDRDTSLPIPILLAARLENVGLDVDLALPWDVPHGGNYDLDELFAWIDRICR